MDNSARIPIVGIADDGLDGLSSRARQIIDDATVIVGPEKPLSAVHEVGARKVVLSADLDPVIELIRNRGDEKLVILALGDPLFFGTARYLCEQVGDDLFEIVPHVSIMQLAFARVKESWDEAYLSNLANNDLDRVIDKVRTAETVGLFTTEEDSPDVLARRMLELGIDYFRVYVCENLGSPDERVTQGTLADIAAQTFAPLNVVILTRTEGAPDQPSGVTELRLFGNPDDAFLQSQPKRGLLTPTEVRAVALAELGLRPWSIVWDVGAGSGSVAIEAARIAAQGKVYAIEMDPEDHRLIGENVRRFGLVNVYPVLGQAPQVFADLPKPDAIFVGGTGRMVAQMVETAYQQLDDHGRIVVNVNGIENLAAVRETLDRVAGDCDTWMLNISRGTRQMELLRFESLNPTYLLAADGRGQR